MSQVLRDEIGKIDTIEGIQAVGKLYSERLKQIKEVIGSKVKSSLAVGDTVFVMGWDNGPDKKKGIVKRINIKKAVVDVEALGLYRCPLASLELV
jgi:hypothetical protein